ncbi:MAG: UbiA-like polyprenyltransferase [Longimicrobiales bacterium]
MQHTALPTLTREGQNMRGASMAARLASFVRLPHTLFALPFAGVGAILASYRFAGNVSGAAIFWIVVAFTAARFAAMGFNRIVDRHLDALNPRTQRRELPAGRLSLLQAVAAVAAAALVFVFAAFQLNPVCGWLSPVALAWTFFYSYTKRFSALAHAVLGLSLGIAPVGAYLAIAGQWSEPVWALPLLAVAVMLWVAGFDIVYALQDIEVDRAQRLHSVPAWLGVRRALLVARAVHTASVLCFLAIVVLRAFPVHWLFALAVALMGGLLYYEHTVVTPGKRTDLAELPSHPELAPDVQSIDRAFFRVNVWVSTSFFLFALLDRILLA